MLVSLFLALPSYAVDSSDWTLGTSAILDQNSASYSTTNGVGSPSVVYYPGTSEFIMVFEYYAGTGTNCSAGVWALGIARSSDNATWTVDTDPLLVPAPGDGSYYDCVAAHPSVMLSENSIDGTSDDDLRVYFKGQQGSAACASSTPVWGCNAYTGVGDILVDLDSNGEVESTDVATVPDVLIDQEFGYSNVVQRSEGKYVMMVQKKDLNATRKWDLYVASSYTERGNWGSEFIALRPGQDAWNGNELYTPTMMCMDNGDLQAFIAGHTYTGASITDAGWSVATNADGEGYKWTLDSTEQFAWTSANDWKHLDALRVDDGTNHDEYLIWYSYKDSSDNKIKIKIKTGWTTTSWTGSDVVDRRCD